MTRLTHWMSTHVPEVTILSVAFGTLLAAVTTR